MPTIQSALWRTRARIGATITALMDTQMGLRAVGDASDADLAPAPGRHAWPLAQDAKGSQVALVRAGAHQFVMVPHEGPAAGRLRAHGLSDRPSWSTAYALSRTYVAVLSDSGNEVGGWS